ncbi:MAG TPA: DUF3261 domain-containing protein [Candidatus Binatia bacterium]|nr:DUF3261 domain-containing protein [Candidatus Binatia bacterium]
MMRVKITSPFDRVRSIALGILIFGGCALPVHQPARLGLKLAPSALGESISLQQHLTVERNGRSDELEALLEVDPRRLDLVGLALGQRVLTLHYDGQILKAWRHAMFPAAVRDEDILEDLQLILWPAEAVRQALPAGWRVEEKGLRRTLLIGEMPVTVIHYSGQPRWSGKVELSNLSYQYRLIIQSVSNGP